MAPYAPPLGCKYSELALSKAIQSQTMFQIIGKDGCVFKAITHQSRTEYIWWNSERNVIEIWGYSDWSIANAYSRLKMRVDEYLQKQISQQLATATVNYDNEFPSLQGGLTA